MAWVGVYYPPGDVATLRLWIQKGVTRFHFWYDGNNGFIDNVVAAGNAEGVTTKVWIELAWPWQSNPYDQALLINLVNNSKNHAGVEGYFNKDEADLAQTPHAQVLQAYNDIKALTSKPVTMVMPYLYGDGTPLPNGIQYVDCADRFGIDQYLVPYSANLNAQVIDATQQSVAAAAGKQIDWVAQSFGWGTTFSPPQEYGRIPTVAEMTTYGTAARGAGAQDMWIYTRHGNVENPPNEPMENFNALCYAALADIIEDWGLAGSPPPSSRLMALHQHGLAVGAA